MSAVEEGKQTDSIFKERMTRFIVNIMVARNIADCNSKYDELQ